MLGLQTGSKMQYFHYLKTLKQVNLDFNQEVKNRKIKTTYDKDNKRMNE